MKLDDLLAALPRLQPDQIKAIQAACGALLGASTPKATKATDGPPKWLFEGIKKAVGTHWGYESFMQQPVAKEFKKHSPAWLEFTAEIFGPLTKKRIPSIAINGLLLDLLMRDLRARDVPCTLKVVCLNLSRAKELFERSFPGYIEAGLVNMIKANMGLLKYEKKDVEKEPLTVVEGKSVTTGHNET